MHEKTLLYGALGCTAIAAVLTECTIEVERGEGVEQRGEPGDLTGLALHPGVDTDLAQHHPSVLIDDREVRAVMTASWLKQMGWRDVFVLAAGGSEKGRPPAPVLGAAPSPDRRR